jgi:hypothetical protein
MQTRKLVLFATKFFTFILVLHRPRHAIPVDGIARFLARIQRNSRANSRDKLKTAREQECNADFEYLVPNGHGLSKSRWYWGVRHRLQRQNDTTTEPRIV